MSALQPYTISQAARRSGIPAKTIRYYENVGLITPARRSDSGYRLYEEKDVEELLFIQRARSLGFSLTDITGLLAMWHDPTRVSAHVQTMAQDHLNRLTQKLTELHAMRQTLEELVRQCHGDERSDCAIIDQLSGLDRLSRHRASAEDFRPSDLATDR